MPELIEPTMALADSYRSAMARSEGDPSVEPPAGWVHSTEYWWVEGETFLGSLRIRHTLTAGLLRTGGHIGYDIAPAHRLRGHGTAMLRAALPRVAALGVNPALITCDTGNVGSRKIIEHNGGRFEDERAGKLRYWISTAHSSGRPPDDPATAR